MRADKDFEHNAPACGAERHCGASSPRIEGASAKPPDGAGAHGGRPGQPAPKPLDAAEQWLRENDPEYEAVSRQGWTNNQGLKHGGWRQLRRGSGTYRIPRERETLQGLAGLPGSQPWTPGDGDDDGDGRTYDFRLAADLDGRRCNAYAPGRKDGLRIPRYTYRSAFPSLMGWLGFERTHSRAPWRRIVKPRPPFVDSTGHRRNREALDEKLTNRALRSYFDAPLDARNGTKKEHTRALRRAFHNGIADSIWIAHLEGIPQWRNANTHKVSERTVRYVITRKEQMQNEVLLAVREEGEKTRHQLDELFSFILALRGETPGEAAERILEEKEES
jgi:hypothetical protein